MEERVKQAFIYNTSESETNLIQYWRDEKCWSPHELFMYTVRSNIIREPIKFSTLIHASYNIIKLKEVSTIRTIFGQSYLVTIRTIFGQSFTPQILISMQQTAFNNIVRKEEIARNEQFLLFLQCFLLNQKIVSPLVNIS